MRFAAARNDPHQFLYDPAVSQVTAIDDEARQHIAEGISRRSNAYPADASRVRSWLMCRLVLMLIMKFQFISSRGNEYFCEIDEDYLTDRFNLTGLNTEVQYYQYALDLVTDVFDMEVDDDMREQIEKSARHLYGLVHARYVVTTRGLAKMVSSWFRIPMKG